MLQFLQILVVLGAIGGVLMVLWRPYLVVAPILALWSVEQLLQVYVPLFSARRSLFNFIVGGLAVLALMVRLARRERMMVGYLNGSTMCVAGIYLLWLAGMVYTPAPNEAREQFMNGYAYIVLLLFFLPMLVLDIFEFRKIMPALMALGAATAVLIMLNPNSSFHSGRLYLDLGMMSGPDRFGSPLALGELGGLIALVAVLFRPERATGYYTLLRAVTFIAGMGVAIGSGSRGQVLGAAIACVMFFPLARRVANPKQFFINVVGLGIVVGGLYMVFKLFIGSQNEQRWNALGMLQDTTLRLEMVWNLLDEFLSRPSHWLFGLGTNAYAAIATDQYTKYVHNIAAEMLCEHGLVGGALFAAMAYLTFRNGIRLWSLYRDDPSMRATTALLMAICANALFLSLKQGSMSYPAPFFWWMVLSKLYEHEKIMLAAEESSEPALEAQQATVGSDDQANQGDDVDPALAMNY